MFYKIEGLGAGFNGLVVEGSIVTLHDSQNMPFGVLSVEKIFSPDTVIGDRVASRPIPPLALYVDFNFLVPTENPNDREFAANNPFGKVLVESNYVQGKLRVSACLYETEVFAVSVLESNESGTKTLYSHNFTVKSKIEKANKLITETVGRESDIEDLVNELRAIED